MTLLELATRCEQATGPDRAIDRAIQLAIRKPVPSDKWTNRDIILPQKPRHFTASLDAAMTLVPDNVKAATVNWSPIGSAVAEIYIGNPGPMVGVECATPALALCAAALRARAGGEQ